SAWGSVVFAPKRTIGIHVFCSAASPVTAMMFARWGVDQLAAVKVRKWLAGAAASTALIWALVLRLTVTLAVGARLRTTQKKSSSRPSPTRRLAVPTTVRPSLPASTMRTSRVASRPAAVWERTMTPVWGLPRRRPSLVAVTRTVWGTLKLAGVKSMKWLAGLALSTAWRVGRAVWAVS